MIDDNGWICTCIYIYHISTWYSRTNACMTKPVKSNSEVLQWLDPYMQVAVSCGCMVAWQWVGFGSWGTWQKVILSWRGEELSQTKRHLLAMVFTKGWQVWNSQAHRLSSLSQYSGWFGKNKFHTFLRFRASSSVSATASASDRVITCFHYKQTFSQTEVL